MKIKNLIKTKKENNENIINVNKNKEIKANSHESKILTNSKITNDFNIKRFEKKEIAYIRKKIHAKKRTS